jgi:putative SOS response-associated peptidase YedK
MCYGKSLTAEQKKLEQEMRRPMKIADLYEPYYHANGFDFPMVYIITQQTSGVIVPAYWALLPNNTDSDLFELRKKFGNNTLNARIENLFTSNLWREPAQERRCLVLATGFFEPHWEGDICTNRFCYQKDQKLFAFAGLYNSHSDDFDQPLYTTTIITQDANPYFAEVHNKAKRMPTVLSPDVYDDWLRPDSLTKSQINGLLMDGFTKADYYNHTVGIKKINGSSNHAGVLESIAVQGSLF